MLLRVYNVSTLHLFNHLHLLVYTAFMCLQCLYLSTMLYFSILSLSTNKDQEPTSTCQPCACLFTLPLLVYSILLVCKASTYLHYFCLSTLLLLIYFASTCLYYFYLSTCLHFSLLVYTTSACLHCIYLSTLRLLVYITSTCLRCLYFSTLSLLVYSASTCLFFYGLSALVFSLCVACLGVR